MNAPGSILWLARHELTLSWRDFLTMMTAGKRKREGAAIIFTIIAALVLHLLAWVLVTRSIGHADRTDAERWMTITALLVLPFSLMMSQAMESVTRAFYSRSDLDLILSSPASVRRLFAVRVGGIAISTTLLSLLLGAPLVNVLALLEGPAWLAAYPVLLAIGTVATVLSLSLTVFLFRVIGAKRTRLIAQIVAALVGASFIIGIQLAAITSLGTISRMSFLTSEAVRSRMPDADSVMWIPARAVTGELVPTIVVIALAGLAFVLSVTIFAGGFGEKVIAAAGIASSRRAAKPRRTGFRSSSVRGALRRKEWKLLMRDHWLVSHTLMQIFYLVPPAFMLWKGLGGNGAVPAVVLPVLVMAAGQLSGGLAWLAISGEDAPQLVSTAPVTPAMILRAKIEAVLGALLIVVAPILAVMAWVDPWSAFVCFVGILAAAVSAIIIQLWFRSQARRSDFRRRQTSSKVATFTEAFSSIFWAGAAGLAAHGSTLALAMACLAIAVLVIARVLRSPPTEAFA